MTFAAALAHIAFWETWFQTRCPGP